MLARIIFCVAIAAAVLAVVLLATVSPLPHHRPGGHKGAAAGQRTFTVYIHPTVSSAAQQGQAVEERRGGASALVFHHRMTAAPESSSRTLGAASGFVLLPAGERGAAAAAAVFDTMHLAFDGAAGLSGSLCVEASNRRPGKGGRDDGEEEEVMRVVGGTGAFAFARGHAVLRRQRTGHGATAAPLLLELSVSSAGTGS